MKIGFIGTGDIVKALVTGLDRARYEYDEIIVSRRNAEISARLAQDCARVRVSDDNQAIVDEADMLFLAVRPQVATEVLSALRFRIGQLVVSVIGMLPHEQLRRWTGPDVTIVRAMPLPFVATCEGPTAMCPHNDEVVRLFNALGRAVVAKTNDEMETLVVASCTMGFYFGLQEVLSDWLRDKGISTENSRAYINTIYLDLAKTATDQEGTSLEVLRREHSTPGGLNEQMHRVFAEHGGHDAMKAALDSVFARMRRANPSES